MRYGKSQGQGKWGGGRTVLLKASTTPVPEGMIDVSIGRWLDRSGNAMKWEEMRRIELVSVWRFSGSYLSRSWPGRPNSSSGAHGVIQLTNRTHTSYSVFLLIPSDHSLLLFQNIPSCDRAHWPTHLSPPSRSANRTLTSRLARAQEPMSQNKK